MLKKRERGQSWTKVLFSLHPQNSTRMNSLFWGPIFLNARHWYISVPKLGDQSLVMRQENLIISEMKILELSKCFILFEPLPTFSYLSLITTRPPLRPLPLDTLSLREPNSIFTPWVLFMTGSRGLSNIRTLFCISNSYIQSYSLLPSLKNAVSRGSITRADSGP